MEIKYKGIYDAMLECGELKQLFRGMTGVWEKDSILFIKAQEELEDIIRGKEDIEIEEIYEDYN